MLESKGLKKISAGTTAPSERTEPWGTFVINKLNQTQKLFRSSRFATDSRGHNVLVDSAETGTLELMSTQMLQTVIDSNDAEANDNLRKIAEGESGLVAHDIDKNRFEVISDEELQGILDGSEKKLGVKSSSSLVDEGLVETVDGDDALDLVSTQMLRIALNMKDDEQTPVDALEIKGFDPYNKG